MAVGPFLPTKAQRFFVGTVLIQAIAALVIVAVIFNRVEDKVDLSIPRYRTVSCYLALFAMAEIFESLMAFDALRLRNVIQLIGILFFHLALVVMAALQIQQTKTALLTGKNCDTVFNEATCDGPGSLWASILPPLVVVPCLLGASWVAMLFWTKQLYAEFGWAIFHVVGANPRMKAMYQWYQALILLLKLDFIAFLSTASMLLIIVLQRDSAEFGITIAAIPVVLSLLILCGVAVQREIKSVMAVSLAMMLAAETYFVYKLVRFYHPDSYRQYETTRGTLTFFTIIAFLLLFATFVVGLRCFSDFDRGLLESKVHAAPKRPAYSQYSSDKTNNNTLGMNQHQGSYSGGVPLGPRISIE